MSAPIVLALLLTLGGASGASAQSNPSVSYQTGAFTWDAPVGGSTPSSYTLSCGPYHHSVAATTGVADADTGAPAANDVIVNIFYK